MNDNVVSEINKGFSVHLLFNFQQEALPIIISFYSVFVFF